MTENLSGRNSKPPAMTEESGARVSNDASQTRQRKKRKWDQPAESLVSAGLAVPGALPLGNVGLLGGMTLPGVSPMSGAINPLAAGFPTVPQAYQVPLIPQQAATVIQKLIQPKIQDELIAREIVINDAESSIRYKLTKRQTQEEIQRCTGAVVITRGKYHPPNASTDGEKPLYLHISAGANIKETTERILAVDRAAAMVEEMLKQGQNLHLLSLSSLSTVSNGLKEPSTCVYLGFGADPSLNIAARIRGPSDQYINHIMNETGATVLLKGRGSGNIDCLHGEEGQQPLHLFLSSNNLKSLEDARLLAEHLLDTISVECGVSRVSSSKVYSAIAPPQQVYSAVPPPHQLSAGVQSSGNEVKAITTLASATVGLTPAPPVSSVGTPVTTTIFTQGTVSQSGGFSNGVQSQSSSGGCPQLPSGGTIYSGYGGIYPQVTPLQQVALALRQSTSPITSTIAPTTSVPSTEPQLNTKFSSDSEKEKRPPQRRKFQELPVSSKGPAKVHQELDLLKPPELASDLGVRNVSTMPAPKKLVQQVSNGMPPPPPRTMPPPPPKFTSSTQVVKETDKNNVLKKTKSDNVPDTLVKLMEYGEDDDDSEETDEQSPNSNPVAVTARKPFWAL